MPRTFTLSDFDFDLPPDLVAQHPAAQRSSARLLDARAPVLADRVFHALPGLLRSGDLLVLNDTRVMKARFFGEKASGGKLEILVERVLGGNQVAAHLRVSKKPAPGDSLALHTAPGQADGLRATLLGRWPDAGGPLFRFVLSNDAGDDPYTLMERHGHMPLPPYIARQQDGADPDAEADAQRYQTVFAEPWQAQAFAMAVQLHAKGVFTWPQWAHALSQTIAQAGAAGDPDDGSGYYQHWVDALEHLVLAQGLGTAEQIHRFEHAWEAAAVRTPHGQPIEVQTQDFSPHTST